ncbi:MAG: mannitol dehydrogenase [Abditibacteriota bacterium]|nr:mannitol dehydrogenase [Abditibacteriota bacterium]
MQGLLKKKAIQYGAGNIGRGFIGQLYHQSGYEVAFIDVLPVVLETLNKDHKYPINIVSDTDKKEIIIDNVRAIDGKDVDAIAEEIATCDIMSTAIGVRVLPYIIPNIAKGIKRRWEITDKPLNIIICENLLGADEFIREKMKDQFTEEEYKKFLNTVGLVEASIGRMVPAPSEEDKAKHPLIVNVEPYCELPVDKAAFKGEIPNIVNLKPFAPFEFFIKRKLFVHNMSHATCAYLGGLKGYTYTYESMANSDIKLICKWALDESTEALSKEYDYPLSELMFHANELLFRFANHRLGDTVARVGKDPLRKLSENDRLIGALKCCVKNNVDPTFICIGIAAGLLFRQEDDEASITVSNLAKEKGVKAALKEISNFECDTCVPKIEKFYEMLKEKPLNEIIAYAQTIKYSV